MHVTVCTVCIRLALLECFAIVFSCEVERTWYHFVMSELFGQPHTSNDAFVNIIIIKDLTAILEVYDPALRKL